MTQPHFHIFVQIMERFAPFKKSIERIVTWTVLGNQQGATIFKDTLKYLKR